MKIFNNISFYFFLTALIFSLFQISVISYAQQEKAEKSIVVKDYTWGSAGMGRSAILQDITLKNTSINEFRNIEIEIELYTKNDIPLGSLRGTIRDVLPAGSEKTFTNIDFGIMHSDLQKTFARVVEAKLIEKGTPSHPRHLLIVKDFEWKGGQYGTEGILKEITIENRSTKNYKDIKLRLSDLGVSGPKVGPEGYTTNFVINNFIPAGSTKTFTNVNVGFRHPDATGTNIYVLNASLISKKEIRYRLGKDKKTEVSKDYDSETYTQSSKPEEERLSLAERYRKKLKEEDEKARAATANTDDKNEDTTIETTNNTEQKTVSDKVAEKQELAATDNTTNYEIAEIDEMEVPIPREDILVEDFKWGSGVPGSLGVIRELTLRNRSGITYTKIDIVVDFLSRQGVPLASNDFKLYEVLPPGETRTFEDIKVGIIVVLPDEKNMTISIKNATDLN